MSDAGPRLPDDDLLAFADGRLDVPRSRAVEDWLAEHPEDSRRVEAWRRQTTLLKAMLDPVAAEPVPPSLSAVARRRYLPRLPPAYAAAAAACLAFAAGLMLGWSLWQADPPDPQRTFADAALAAHRIYTVEVRHPVEVRANEEAHLVAWLGKRLGTPIRAPDLSSAGLTLLGGRLLAAEDQPGALLMYEGRSGERYTLLMQRFAPERMTAFRYAERDDAAAFYWVDGELGYVLTGPKDSPALLRIAERVYEQLD